MDYNLAKQLRYILLEEMVGGYQSQHQFLVRNHGNPKECEFCEVKGTREKGGRWSIHWALKHGKRYSHDKNDYYALCRRCHGKYDLTDEKRENLIKAATGKKGKSEAKSRIALSRKRDIYGHFIKTTA